jgi:hypothetical protein
MVSFVKEAHRAHRKDMQIEDYNPELWKRQNSETSIGMIYFPLSLSLCSESEVRVGDRTSISKRERESLLLIQRRTLILRSGINM